MTEFETFLVSIRGLVARRMQVEVFGVRIWEELTERLAVKIV